MAQAQVVVGVLNYPRGRFQVLDRRGTVGDVHTPPPLEAVPLGIIILPVGMERKQTCRKRPAIRPVVHGNCHYRA